MDVTDTIDFEPKKNPGDKLRRVLIIQFGPMRSFLQGIAASAYVRRTHRSAHIVLLTEPRFEAFAKACPYFNDVEVYREQTAAFLQKKLKSSKIDMIYDFQNDPLSADISLHIKPKFTSAIHKNATYTPPEGLDKRHYTQDIVTQLHAANIGPTETNAAQAWSASNLPRPDYSWIKAAMRNSPRLEPAYFNLYDRYALIIPGGPLDESEDCWDPDKFAEVCKNIADAGIIPAVIGNSTQGRAGQIIHEKCEKAVNLISRADMFQTISLAQNASFFVGGETGPTYLVSSTNLAGVVLFRQDWSIEHEGQFSSIWDDETRLGRLAPKGGNLVFNTAPDIAEISPEDIWRSVLALNVL
jgi:ADP-heptose:LPS heptosyltransferase